MTDVGSSRDDLFQGKDIPRDFEFNEDVAAVFEDMLSRSVPYYREIIRMEASLLREFLKAGDGVYDLGCSTGTTLMELSRELNDLNLIFTGVDSSPAMIKKARRKARQYSMEGRLKFMEDDIISMDLDAAGAVFLNYTLQFIRPVQRPVFLKKVFSFLRPGGVLIISEKNISHDPLLNRVYIDFYLQFKKKMGYSELEISRKREALENVLIPFSIQENLQMIRDAGFSHVESFFQWFNFSSIIAVKEDEHVSP